MSLSYYWNGEDCLGSGWGKNTGNDFEEFLANVIESGINKDQLIQSGCDLFHHKECCYLVVNGDKVRGGDSVVFEDGKFSIERGPAEPIICPTHNVEHTGTTGLVCMTTGEIA